MRWRGERRKRLALASRPLCFVLLCSESDACIFLMGVQVHVKPLLQDREPAPCKLPGVCGRINIARRGGGKSSRPVYIPLDGVNDTRNTQNKGYRAHAPSGSCSRRCRRLALRSKGAVGGCGQRYGGRGGEGARSAKVINVLRERAGKKCSSSRNKNTKKKSFNNEEEQNQQRSREVIGQTKVTLYIHALKTETTWHQGKRAATQSGHAVPLRFLHPALCQFAHPPRVLLFCFLINSATYSMASAALSGFRSTLKTRLVRLKLWTNTLGVFSLRLLMTCSLTYSNNRQQKHTHKFMHAKIIGAAQGAQRSFQHDQKKGRS